MVLRAKQNFILLAIPVGRHFLLCTGRTVSIRTTYSDAHVFNALISFLWGGAQSVSYHAPVGKYIFFSKMNKYGQTCIKRPPSGNE